MLCAYKLTWAGDQSRDAGSGSLVTGKDWIARVRGVNICRGKCEMHGNTAAHNTMHTRHAYLRNEGHPAIERQKQKSAAWIKFL